MVISAILEAFSAPDRLTQSAFTGSPLQMKIKEHMIRK
jgi:hypothetical protein